jgi:hypothetical protein
MADEITTYSDVTSLIANYREGIGDEEDRFRSSVGERKLLPTLTLDKKACELVLSSAGQVGAQMKVMYLTFMDLYATRALWPPEADKEAWGKRPVCSIGFSDPNVFKPGNDRGIGRWLINPRYSPPYNVGVEVKDGELINYKCASCPWNQFETKASWERKESSTKAKACGESRAVFVKIMQKGPALPTDPAKGEELFFFKDSPILDNQSQRYALLQVTLGTHRKVFEDVALMVAARNVPMSAAVWKCTVKKEESGGFDYGVLVPEFAGLADPATFKGVIRPLLPEVKEFVKRNSNVILDDKGEPIPF